MLLALGQSREGLLVVALMVKNWAEPIASNGVAGINRQRLLDLIQSFVEQTEVKVDQAEIVVRLIEVWIDGQSAPILLSGSLMGKVIGRCP